MQIVVTYDSTVSSAPAGFTAAVEAAVAYYESHFDAAVTINITIGWGSADGELIPDGAVGAASPAGILLTYEQVRNALWYDARTNDTLTAAMNLPAADPTNGGMFFMTTAQAKAVGLIAGSDPATDGTIIIDDASDYTFDPNNRAVAGKYDIIGVLEHEIGHILGRVSFLGETLPGGAKLYGALDLFRYSAPGTLAPTATNTYFSIDGQNLLLPFNDPLNGGSESDWSIAITGDVFDAFAELGVQPQFSATDHIMQDLFGYHPHQGAPATPLPNTSPLGGSNLADNAQIAQGQTIYFSDLRGYSLQGGATNAGTIVNSAAGGTAIFANVAASGLFTNTLTGIVMAQATGNDTSRAFDLESSQNILNSGLIQSVSQGNARGVVSWSPNFVFTNTASGILRVWGKYDAAGVVFNNGGMFDNAGLVEVVGDTGPSISQTGATGVINATSFNNRGTIKVTSTYSGPSIGVLIGTRAPGDGLFTNSGMIVADFAFYVSLNSSSFQPDINIVNSGKIVGSILLVNGFNQILNTGIIGGDIFFGNTASLYDGAGGRLYGRIFLGHAANTVTLSGDGGTVYGGGGADIINGGAGNDTFLIARGANQLNGGGGFNTLSLQAAARSFTVDLTAGTAVGAGTSTIANIQRVLASDFGDTLIAGNAAATFIGGAGADVMRGGAAADTLIASAGGDTLTGNGGNDTLIYAAGDGQVVITDFRANGNQDVLKVFGYAGAVSTQQQGADTLIALSGGDSIRLKNVSAASLTGGAVTYNVRDYAGPLTPMPQAKFGTGGNIYLNYALTVYAGEQISGYLGSSHLGYVGIRMDGNTNKPGVITGIDSFGSMSFSADGGDLYGIDMDGNIEDASAFINRSGASFSVVNSNGNAHGIRAYFSGNTPDLVNAGNFQVTAHGPVKEAKGVFTHDSGFAFNNTATGTFTVSSDDWAYGLDMHNSGVVRNDGQFNVSGSGNVYGILQDNFGIAFYSSGYGSTAAPIINNGSITVSGTPGSTTYGILLSGTDTVQLPPAPIINTGTISAQIAIQAWDPGYSPHQAPSVDIQNSGTINGDIILGGAISRISNTGTINGNIFIRNDYAGYTFNYFPQYGLTYGPGDTVDLRGGNFNGYVDISPGHAGDVDVKDVIYTGTATTTVKISGGQSNLTAIVRANPGGHTTVEFDMASSGATWSKRANGSWVVSAGDRGTETLFNVEALRFTNTTITLGYVSLSTDADTTGDGKADILWQNSDGRLSISAMNGASVSSTAVVATNIGAGWYLKGTGDFDYDGKADALFQHSDGRVLAWLIDGGTLRASISVANPGASWRVIASGDFNADYNADIVLQKNDGQVAIWLMDGTTVASSAMVGASPGAAWQAKGTADFDGDGKADILLQNSNGQVAVWLMNGATKAGEGFVSASSGWNVVGAGDFGGDGKADILLQNGSTGALSIWRMNGGTRLGEDAVAAVPGQGWRARAVDDVDGDGKADILLEHNDGEGAVWLMNGAARTGFANFTPNSDAGWRLANGGLSAQSVPFTERNFAADFSGDGRADMLWQKTDGTVLLWQTNSDGLIISSVDLGVVDPSVAILSGVGDYNGDGRSDILLRGADGSVTIWLMNGAVTTGTRNPGTMDGSWTLKGSGDFGGDGKADMLWQKSDGTVVIWQMNANGAIASSTTLGVVPLAWSLSNVADYNGDGKADILLRNTDGTVANWLMNGAAIVGSNTLGTMNSSWTVKAVGDFGGDGKADIWWHKSDGTVQIWQMNNAGAIASNTFYGVIAPSVFSFLATADYNGDGRADTVTRNTGSGDISAQLMNGVQNPVSRSWGTLDNPIVSPAHPTFSDFAGNGNADILWQKADGGVVIWEMNSSGGIAASTDLGVQALSLLGIGDYNGDGRADVLGRASNGAVTAWLMNGAVIANTRSLVGTMDSSWSLRGSGDFNGDGVTDILWQKADGSASFWIMNTNGLNGTTATLTANTQFISVGDYNGDGKADILTRSSNGSVTNWLMNGHTQTGSNALGTMDSSWSVKGSGDFGGDGKSDILWQKSDGTILIWQMNGAGAIASSTNLGNLNPATWSLAGIADYNGDGKADILLRNANGDVYTWLMNGAAIAGSSSTGPMSSSAVAVPIPVTIAPPVFSVSNDFDGGGKADLLWHKADGTVVLWQMNAGGAPTVTNVTTANPSTVVGIGDYNGDGKADVLQHNADGTVTAWLMNGATIASTTNLNTRDSSWSVGGSGDFNGDGVTDILWQKADGSRVIWLMNASGGIFSTSTTTVSGAAVSVGDYNGDGKADILMRDGNAVSVRLMDANLIGSSVSHGVMNEDWQVKGSGDFGGDGKADILWQKSDGTIWIFQMNGSGGIASTTNLGVLNPAIWSLSGVADYNGDGKADILLRNANGDVYTWLMNGAAIAGSTSIGSMSSSAVAVPAPVVISPPAISVSNDFDGGGKADLLWHRADGTVVVWQMNAGGAPPTVTNVTTANPSTVVSIGDYNGDGKADVLQHNADGTVTAWLMNGAAIASTTNLNAMDSSWSVRGSGDFDGDGRTDILWQKTDGSLALWKMSSSGTISSVTSTSSNASAVSVGDYNGDGVDDILMRTFGGAVSVRLMQGNFNGPANNLDSMDTSWQVKGSGDFGGDGKSDILWQKSDGTILIWQMSSAGTIASRTSLGVLNPATWSLSGVADYNGDGKTDILLRNANGDIYTWLMNGAAIAGSNSIGAMSSSAVAIPAPVVISPPAISVSNDFDGGGRADILWHRADGTVTFWQTNAGAPPTVINTTTVNPSVSAIVGFGDYNGDGKADVLLRNANDTVSAWLMNGSIISSTVNLGGLNYFWSYRGSDDFDGDGRTDILWQRADGYGVIWEMNGAGTVFSTVTFAFGVPANSKYIGVGDYDGDGKADILSREDSGQVGVHLMDSSIDGSPRKAFNLLDTMDSSWAVKGSGDFGGDGKADILWQKSDGTILIWEMNAAGKVASRTNLGVLNPATWSLSAVADYNGDGKSDILLRNANGDVYSWQMDGATIAGSQNLGTMSSSAAVMPGVRPDPHVPVAKDLDRDGHADILWHNSDGTVVVWRMNGAGAIGSTTNLSSVNPAASSFAGIGDYNGDGTYDLLLRESGGGVTEWRMRAAAVSGTSSLMARDSSWSLRGSGDFDNDNVTDLLWQKSDGTTSLWKMDTNGNILIPQGLGVINSTVEAVGDFDGSGHADILMRDANGLVVDWSMIGSNVRATNNLGTVDSSWTVKGVGDFNGDRRDDILWQKSDGTVAMWQMDANGRIGTSTNLGVVNPAAWSLLGVGDYNGDGKADVLLRSSSGVVANWLMDGAAIVGSNTLGTMNNSWTAITR